MLELDLDLDQLSDLISTTLLEIDRTIRFMPKFGSQSPGGTDGGSKAATTFVQADSTCFRDLVQRLTGPSGNQTLAVVKAQKKPIPKLHERRKYARPNIEIATPATAFNYQVQSKTTNFLDATAASPSSSSTLQAIPISRSPPVAYSHVYSNKRVFQSSLAEINNAGELEKKATKEKRFLDDSIAAQPQLLTLFPLTSPTADAFPNKLT